jgi:putative cell wall-binding protein
MAGGQAATAATARVDRLAGADRYAVSAAVSAETFPAGVPVAFLASGLVFSDALSGAPAATRLGGPVLLTHPGGLPTSISNELERLRPTKIVILGGPGSVTPVVEEQLAAQFSVPVERWDGADRYAASAAISARAFATGTPTAFVANGLVFSDALSGAPAAARQGGPVLLTAAEAVPTSIEEELRRLRPARVVVLGGIASVSAAVAARIAAVTGATLERWEGHDRYTTSASISAKTYTGSVPVAYLANGLGFADALSGASAAGRLGGPVLLTQAGGLPSSIIAELRRLKPARIVMLGGPASIAPGVEAQLRFVGADLPAASGGRLTAGTEIRAGSCLGSPDGSHTLCVGTGGQFGVYRGQTLLWSSGTTDPSPWALRIRSDGSLVLHRSDGSVIWESSTAGTGASELVMQNDGDVMLRTAGGQIVWSTMTSAAAPRWKLPYAAGQSWAAGGPHANSGGAAGARGALDFGPRAGGDRRVLSIADGTVYRLTCGGGSYLGVNHVGGWQSTYYHLVNYQEHLVGQFVPAGTYLGDVGRTVPCGGGATFDHVHLVIRRAGIPVSVEGMRFGGFTARSSGQDYWGYWTNAAGQRVLTSPGGAACCLPAQ